MYTREQFLRRHSGKRAHCSTILLLYTSGYGCFDDACRGIFAILKSKQKVA